MHRKEMKIASKFLLRTIDNILILSIFAINKGFDLVLFVSPPPKKKLPNCTKLDVSALTNETSMRKFGFVLYFSTRLSRKS
jgi:hypothetical protein